MTEHEGKRGKGKGEGRQKYRSFSFVLLPSVLLLFYKTLDYRSTGLPVLEKFPRIVT